MNEYDRVTAVLSPFSGFSRINPQVLQNAQERGTKVHEYVDALLADLDLFDINERFAGYLESAQEYISGKSFIDKPSRFFDEENMITGECDAIYKNKSGFTLVDFKTSANEGKTWYLQASAYSWMAKKAGINITKIEFVKLNKEGKSPKIYEYEEKFSDFLKCLEVYRMFFKNLKEEDLLACI